MRHPKYDDRIQSRFTINITPLIDVIFLLMIFFIMTINLNLAEGVLDNRLPQISSQNIADSPQDWEIVRLKIKLIRSDGRLKIYLQERVVYSYTDLLYYLNRLPEDIQIVMEPNDDVPYKHVIGVYNTCLKSHKRNIVFGVSH